MRKSWLLAKVSVLKKESWDKGFRSWSCSTEIRGRVKTEVNFDALGAMGARDEDIERF